MDASQLAAPKPRIALGGREEAKSTFDIRSYCEPLPCRRVASNPPARLLRYASAPPSALRTAPVVTLAAGLAGKTTAFAISRGSASHPSEVMSHTGIDQCHHFIRTWSACDAASPLLGRPGNAGTRSESPLPILHTRKGDRPPEAFWTSSPTERRPTEKRKTAMQSLLPRRSRLPGTTVRRLRARAQSGARLRRRPCRYRCGCCGNPARG